MNNTYSRTCEIPDFLVLVIHTKKSVLLSFSFSPQIIPEDLVSYSFLQYHEEDLVSYYYQLT